MTIGSRLREMLKAKGLSQAELARRVGLTQPAINALIRGSSRSSLSLHKIARELDTTPAYLTGETDDPNSDGPPQPELSRDEMEMVELYRAARPGDRPTVMKLLQSLALIGEQAGQTIHDERMKFRAEDEDPPRRRAAA